MDYARAVETIAGLFPELIRMDDGTAENMLEAAGRNPGLRHDRVETRAAIELGKMWKALRPWGVEIKEGGAGTPAAGKRRSGTPCLEFSGALNQLPFTMLASRGLCFPWGIVLEGMVRDFLLRFPPNVVTESARHAWWGGGSGL